MNRTADCMAAYLLHLIERHDANNLCDWLAEAIRCASAVHFRDEEFHQHFAAAGRRFARLPPDPEATQLTQLRVAGAYAPEHWAAADHARTLLLTHALHALPYDAHVAFVGSLYRMGDNAEQHAVLRSLILLPEPARFVDIGVNGCRSNVRDVFETIACENAFPAQHFPPLHFNQLVLKALFIGVPAARVVGLQERHTAELARMVSDYVSERTAAGRSVSADAFALQHGPCMPRIRAG